MKLAMPIIVVLPGIAAYVLHKNGGLQQEMLSGGKFNSDNAYSAVLGFLPTGLKGTFGSGAYSCYCGIACG
jgi:SSS family solute:Na+ symporter